MKIWIDITNSPHVLFFEPFLKKFQSVECSFLVTALDNSHVIDLLNKKKIPHKVIGKHSGKSILSKAKGFYLRSRKLFDYVKHMNIAVSISHQSPYSMWASKKSNISKRIYVFDNDRAKLQNFLGFRYSTLSICPKATKHPKSIYYSGLKESIYLWNFKEAKSFLNQIPFSYKDYIVFRPEPWKAQYYKGSSNYSFELVNNLLAEQNVVLIPRDKEQLMMYKEIKNPKLFIPDKVIDAHNLIYNSKLMIGGGGTMNREAVVLGIPVISTYQGDLLRIDRWLVDEGYMAHRITPPLNFCLDWVEKSPSNNLKDTGSSSFDNLADIFLGNK